MQIVNDNQFSTQYTFMQSFLKNKETDCILFSEDGHEAGNDNLLFKRLETVALNGLFAFFEADAGLCLSKLTLSDFKWSTADTPL